jgi:type II secretory pathway predicted ATPase ExeA
MPNLLIVGDTNIGKTMIVKKFQRMYPMDENRNGNAIVYPVLYIQAPPEPSITQFLNLILDEINAPFKPNDRKEKKKYQVLKILPQIGLKILIIDEIHHILAGSLNVQKQFINYIKFFGNQLEIPIVGVGILDAYHAVYNDEQLSNRFERVKLERWKYSEEYLKLLASFEKHINLKNRSNLIAEEISKKILLMSEGIIGEISTIINKAGVVAIETGEEKITIDILNKLDWIFPSKRKLYPS